MFTQTVLPETLELLNKLMKVELLKDMRLVGGTALALQIGHRFSVDLDIFGKKNYTNKELQEQLQTLEKGKELRHGNKEIITSCYINDIKVDIVDYQYPWLDEAIIEYGVRMATLKDIAAMKISAIGSRGAKKDFYDLYFLLDKYTIYEILGFFREKYAIKDIIHFVQSLTYFDDADKTEQPKMFQKLPWKDVKKRIEKEIQNLDFNKL